MSKLIAGPTNNKTELDLNSEVSIPLTFNIADVKDLSNRSGAYSKTIALPGTTKNNRFFGGLHDVNADFSQFNPNVRTPIVLTVSDMETITGFLQLKTIDVSDEGFVTYNVVLYDSTVNLMADIGSLLVVGNPKTSVELSSNTKSVNDIKFNDEAAASPAITRDTQVDMNHLYNYDNIEDSWTGSTAQWNTGGYYYPLLYSTKPTLNVTDFQPAIYHKTLLDGVLKHHGYTWSGSLKDSAKYDREIIPYTGSAPNGEPLISVGVSGLSFNPFYTSTDSLGDISTGAITIPMPVETIDDFNLWNGSTFVCPTDGNYSFDYNMELTSSIEASFPTSVTTGLYHEMTTRLKLIVYNDLNAIVQIVSLSDLNIVNNVSSFSPFTPGVHTTTGSVGHTGSSPDITMEKDWYVRMTTELSCDGVRKSNGDLWTDTANFNIGSCEVRAQGSTFSTRPRPLIEWQEIEYYKMIPAKLKQKDLIHDLIARYNCIIYPNPDNANDIIFDIGEEFYSTGLTADWSDKKDSNTRDKITLLNDITSAKTLLTYTKAADAHNVNYFNASGEIFGQYEYDLDNDFASGTKTIKSPFEPTSIIDQGNGDPALVPALSPNSTTAKFRVLHAAEGLINPRQASVGKYFSLSYLPTHSISPYTSIDRYTYPYAGSYNYPLDISLVTTPDYKPSSWESINFGELAFINIALGTTQPAITLKTLYWETSLRQTSQGKLFTIMLNLNIADLNFIRLNPNAKVYVSNRWWRVNKMVLEANDELRRLTKVELVSVE